MEEGLFGGGRIDTFCAQARSASAGSTMQRTLEAVNEVNAHRTIAQLASLTFILRRPRTAAWQDPATMAPIQQFGHRHRPHDPARWRAIRTGGGGLQTRRPMLARDRWCIAVQNCSPGGFLSAAAAT